MCIIGQGISPNRLITIRDNVNIRGALSINNGLTVNNDFTINYGLTINGGDCYLNTNQIVTGGSFNNISYNTQTFTLAFTCTTTPFYRKSITTNIPITIKFSYKSQFNQDNSVFFIN